MSSVFLYFDPGLGAMIIQTIIAAVAGVILFSKNIMNKIRVFFGFSTNKKNELFEDIEVEDQDVTKKNSGEG